MMTGRHYIKSSSFIMAMLFTILCGSAALCLGYFIDYFARGHFAQTTSAVIDSEIRYLEERGAIPELPDHPHRIYIHLAADGSLPSNINTGNMVLRDGIIVFERMDDKTRYAAKIHEFSAGRKVLIGYDITDIAHDFRFMQGIGIASIVFVMIVVFVSYLISVFVVSGTNKIAITARDIMETGDLTRRIDIGSKWDDLGNMTNTLNMMLSRIQELMHGVRQVSDNIAHDLRTPLTRLRHKIEAVEGAQKEALLKEADHLMATFNALLRISRIETEKQRSRFQSIDLAAVVQDVVDFYEPLAEEKSIAIKVDLHNAPFEGDRDLLFQAYANILDNAVKYAKPGGEIIVSVKQTDIGIEASIQDNGAGVAEKDLEHIFERFYRTEESRTAAGTGLGLSLVKAVIELHRGRVEAQNTEEGFRIITIL